MKDGRLAKVTYPTNLTLTALPCCVCMLCDTGRREGKKKGGDIVERERKLTGSPQVVFRGCQWLGWVDCTRRCPAQLVERVGGFSLLDVGSTNFVSRST